MKLAKVFVKEKPSRDPTWATTHSFEQVYKDFYKKKAVSISGLVLGLTHMPQTSRGINALGNEAFTAVVEDSLSLIRKQPLAYK